MKDKKLNVVIPMAGFGTRLRPHTWSKPRPLISVAGKTVLDHILQIISSAADLESCQLAFIIGYLGKQVREHMRVIYPHVETHYYIQQEMRGQSHAIAMAREQLKGPTLVLFSDTLVEDDMSFLLKDDFDAEAVIWVKQVQDPRRFGVVEKGPDGFVRHLIEKPDTFDNDLAVVGYYYFAHGEDLLAAIDRQIKEELRTKGEYFIADAIDLMLKDGLKMMAKEVEVWLDAGLYESVLDTNRYLLAHGRDNTPKIPKQEGVTIIPPVYIHPDAVVQNATIGPHASVGPGCRVTGSAVSDSVLEAQTCIEQSSLTASLIGERAKVEGFSGSLNIGDDAVVKGEA